jgi:hypothetical protein
MALRSRKDRKKRKNVTLATRLYFPRKDEGRESGCLDSFITSLCFLERMKEMNDRRWKEEAMGIYNISECLRLFVVPLNILSPNPPLPVALLHIPTQVRFQCTQVGQSNSNFFDSRHQTRHHQIRLRPASQIHTYSIPVWDMKDTFFFTLLQQTKHCRRQTSTCASSFRMTTRDAGSFVWSCVHAIQTFNPCH